MMTPVQDWGRFPSGWIADGNLKRFAWKSVETRGIAALRVYTVLAQRLRDADGVVRASYEALTENANLSRASVSAGLRLLEGENLLHAGTTAGGKGRYRFVGYDPKGGWAKLPAQKLYDGSQFRPFKTWHMRSQVELHAMRLYLLIAARRDTKSNEAFLTYEKIQEMTGMRDNQITSGLSLLSASSMVYVTNHDREGHGMARGYRIVGVEPFKHRGTTTRELTVEEMDATLENSATALIPPGDGHTAF